jgi:1-acyl-sn-glycerol-3-phosphate acyltransferase
VPTRFVAKAEIASWPVIGWLVGMVGTLFVERGKRHAVHGVNRVVGEHLQMGETIGVYAEGTTTDGTHLLPFHANLIQPALDHGAEVRPVAVRFSQSGRLSLAASYAGETTLMQSLWRVVTTRDMAVEVHWLPAVDISVGNRHAVARAARAEIAVALGLSDVTEPVVADAVGASRANEPSAQPSPADVGEGACVRSS